MQKIFQGHLMEVKNRTKLLVAFMEKYNYNVAQRWVGFTGEGDRPNSGGLPKTSHPGWLLILRGG